MKAERYLHFKWAYDYTAKEQILKLQTELQNKNIPFVLYRSNGYYSHEWIIAKSKYSWSDIMSIINNVKPAKYNYISSHKERMVLDEQTNKYAMCCI